MGRKKYKTEDERKAAQRESNRRWRKDNPEYMVKYRSAKKGRAKNLLSGYKQKDEMRNRGECLIDEQWIINNIFNSKCVYCGESDWHKLGADRIDNTLPHTPENCVCSCWDCNNKRNRTPYDEFMRMIGKIA